MITHKPKIQRLFAAAAVILTSLMMISTSLPVSAADADSVLNNSEWNIVLFADSIAIMAIYNNFVPDRERFSTPVCNDVCL